uniref:Cyclin-dependent kinase 2 homolog n=1 Tax=Chromera velia CCMP2878 TaxID=1169474 RepID=A0A0G4GTA3_9ALVE|eukprot:Cvel_5154.t1-p1 / transcript=Cvel_5154.t1 / gene=Cvel_5154 / organism=Chromera_velia_CCMP2878 / gene_product=hypothetical protein / transcript_product=hypothetical protein / location=Cvel_scaffold236:42963-48447(+) / protein_length=1081 / sequence_SO=supercontig / SO=protein_coding / is_pseudo=false
MSAETHFSPDLKVYGLPTNLRICKKYEVVFPDPVIAKRVERNSVIASLIRLREKDTGRPVVVKVLRFGEKDVDLVAREAAILTSPRAVHPNIIFCERCDAGGLPPRQASHIYLYLEYLPHTLRELLDLPPVDEIQGQPDSSHTASSSSSSAAAGRKKEKSRKGTKQKERQSESNSSASPNFPPPGPFPLSDQDKKHVAVQLLSALRHLHKEYVIHRDLKPENVLVGRDPASGRVIAKLIDFGLARDLVGNEGNDSAHYTLDNGTLHFCPREQLLLLQCTKLQRKFVREEQDAEAYGKLLLEMFATQRAFVNVEGGTEKENGSSQGGGHKAKTKKKKQDGPSSSSSTQVDITFHDRSCPSDSISSSSSSSSPPKYASVFAVEGLEGVLPSERKAERWPKFPKVQRSKTKFLDAIVTDLILLGAPPQQEVQSLVRDAIGALRWTGAEGEFGTRKEETYADALALPSFVQGWVDRLGLGGRGLGESLPLLGIDADSEVGKVLTATLSFHGPKRRNSLLSAEALVALDCAKGGEGFWQVPESMLTPIGGPGKGAITRRSSRVSLCVDEMESGPGGLFDANADLVRAVREIRNEDREVVVALFEDMFSMSSSSVAPSVCQTERGTQATREERETETAEKERWYLERRNPFHSLTAVPSSQPQAQQQTTAVRVRSNEFESVTLTSKGKGKGSRSLAATVAAKEAENGLSQALFESSVGNGKNARKKGEKGFAREAAAVLGKGGNGKGKMVQGCVAKEKQRAGRAGRDETITEQAVFLPRGGVKGKGGGKGRGGGGAAVGGRKKGRAVVSSAIEREEEEQLGASLLSGPFSKVSSLPKGKGRKRQVEQVQEEKDDDWDDAFASLPTAILSPEGGSSPERGQEADCTSFDGLSGWPLPDQPSAASGGGGRKKAKRQVAISKQDQDNFAEVGLYSSGGNEVGFKRGKSTGKKRIEKEGKGAGGQLKSSNLKLQKAAGVASKKTVKPSAGGQKGLAAQWGRGRGKGEGTVGGVVPSSSAVAVKKKNAKGTQVGGKADSSGGREILRHASAGQKGEGGSAASDKEASRRKRSAPKTKKGDGSAADAAACIIQ